MLQAGRVPKVLGLAVISTVLFDLKKNLIIRFFTKK